MHKIIAFTLFFIFLSVFTDNNYIISEAKAYIGPGVGGGLIASILGVIVAILAAIFGLIWFPLKKYLKKRKERKDHKQNKID